MLSNLAHGAVSCCSWKFFLSDTIRGWLNPQPFNLLLLSCLFYGETDQLEVGFPLLFHQNIYFAKKETRWKGFCLFLWIRKHVKLRYKSFGQQKKNPNFVLNHCETKTKQNLVLIKQKKGKITFWISFVKTENKQIFFLNNFANIKGISIPYKS
jgi:hypothetical protein